jgi:Flp pilus assembly pilin Flp
MKKLIKNQKGQGIMEYVIISSLIGICCLVAVRQFGEVVQKRIENMKSQISSEITLKSSQR